MPHSQKNEVLEPEQPGKERSMHPSPQYEGKYDKYAGKLDGKIAVITGGDSGIGRAIAVAFAREGADISIVYLEEEEDARDTKEAVEEYNHKCLLISGDVSKQETGEKVMKETLNTYGKLDILINNAAKQFPRDTIEDISDEQLHTTFETNVFSQFYMVKAALKHLHEGAAIINTTSVTAYRGSPTLIDYAATKGAIVAFTRSLALSLMSKKIRVNGVAPGPIWTPLIPATFPKDKLEKFGSNVPMGRAGQPEEVAPCYVFLASEDASYMTGQILHPNGGELIGG